MSRDDSNARPKQSCCVCSLWPTFDSSTHLASRDHNSHKGEDERVLTSSCLVISPSCICHFPSRSTKTTRQGNPATSSAPTQRQLISPAAPALPPDLSFQPSLWHREPLQQVSSFPQPCPSHSLHPSPAQTGLLVGCESWGKAVSVWS